MGGRGSGRKPKKDPVFTKGLELYERQDFESDPAWKAFLAYRDLGPGRTVAETVRTLGKRPSYRTTMESWSRKNGWVKRCSAWDRHLDDGARKAAEKETARLAKVKTRAMQKVAEDMYAFAGENLELYREALAEAKRQVAEAAKDGDASAPRVPLIDPKDIKGLADTGIKLARILDGNPGEISETRTTTFADLARKAREQKD